MNNSRFTIFLFAPTIFLAAFLSFQIQPIISKYILPFFGGASYVWVTALLFFQLLLLFGYLYALFLLKIKPVFQFLFHITIIIFTLLTLGIQFLNWQTFILLPKDDYPIFSTTTLTLLLLLFISVGLPYFLLTTTSVLLQKWLSRIDKHTSPYPLYALSNTGSLFALLSYPFLVEPYLSLQTQVFLWIGLFVLYCLCILLSSGLTFVMIKNKTSRSVKTNKLNSNIFKPRGKEYLLWISYSGIASLMLLSISHILTQSVAPVPFLWILPLSIYLITFILCFSEKNWYKKTFFSFLYILLAPFCLIFTITLLSNFTINIVAYSLLLLSACMICHGELFRIRPRNSESLDVYYVCIALGGALGGTFVALLAPVVFKGFWEFYLGTVITLFIACNNILNNKRLVINKYFQLVFPTKKEFYVFFFSACIVITITFSFILQKMSGEKHLASKRNFYGILSITESDDVSGGLRNMVYGKIVHGSQFIIENKRQEPLLYYEKKSGIGLSLTHFPRSQYTNTLRVGLIGLGAGTLAAYGQKGDLYRFYEINPAVIDFAQKYFTYLKDSEATIDIVLGDGRLSLEKEAKAKQEPTYDVLVLDAFSDDAIPTHLLTKEAFTLYLNRLSVPHGLIAIHITNTYIDLTPVIYNLAKYYDLEIILINSPVTKDSNDSTQWMLLSKNKDFFSSPAFQNKTLLNHLVKNKSFLWTDNYSNLLQVLK